MVNYKNKFKNEILLLFIVFIQQLFAQTLPYTFKNSSRYTDNEIYVGLVGKFPGMGDVWMNMISSQLQTMSYSNNTVPGPVWGNTPDGENKYAAMFYRLSDIPNKTIQIPQGLFGCRCSAAAMPGSAPSAPPSPSLVSSEPSWVS